MVKHVKTAAAVLALLIPASPARAQDQETLQKNLEHKLEAEFLKKANWILDFDKAKEEAKKSGKRIFAYFTRSYAR